MNYRVKKSIAFVHDGKHLEIFNTNTREAFRIAIDAGALEVIMNFDGESSIDEVVSIYPGVDRQDLLELMDYLNKKKVVIRQNCTYLPELIKSKPRTLAFLEDYCKATSEVVDKLELIKNKQVMIIGLGAVGSWVAESLVRSGVERLVLIDDDIVDASNLHRQGLFFEADVGSYKVDCAKRYLSEVADIECVAIKEKLTPYLLEKLGYTPDLIINCADYPSVDVTTKLVGMYCMPKSIPHIVGGGYNLHLTLIGQTIIPGKSACANCFEKTLSIINSSDLDGVRKLNRPNRKIGSFGPLTKLTASVTSLEAIKVLIEDYDSLCNMNKRVEFLLETMDFSVKTIDKRDDCEWCSD